MIYLEEDPEIGATIKQNLDSGTPIKMGTQSLLLSL